MNLFNTCKSYLIRNKKKLLCFSLFISLCYILLYLRPTVTNFDEGFTLSLINHSYGKIIYLDSMDVHPPLYYLLLKLFIEITTFWTSYLPLKIIFSRIFSIIVSLVSFVFLHKITSKLKILNNIYIQWILFIALPIVLGIRFPYQQFVNIRMYSLAAMFIVIEYYYLIMFSYTKRHQIRYLSIITLITICSMYTHYYAFIFSGLLILIYSFKFLFNKEFVKSIELVMSGIVSLISFIPWVPVLITQMKMPGTYWMTDKIELKEVIFFIFFIILFIYPLFKYFKFNSNNIFNTQFSVILLVLGSTFIVSIIYSLLKSAIFQVRYMYPVLLIYEFIGGNILIYYLREKCFNKLLLFSIFILFMNVSVSSIYQFIYFDIPSFKSTQIYNKWNDYSHTKIVLPQRYSNGYYDINYVIYIPFVKKDIIVPRSFKVNSHIYGSKTYKEVFHRSISNIYLKK